MGSLHRETRKNASHDGRETSLHAIRKETRLLRKGGQRAAENVIRFPLASESKAKEM
jgi:hypothetical protein